MTTVAPAARPAAPDAAPDADGPTAIVSADDPQLTW
jgi:hypothetical protein